MKERFGPVIFLLLRGLERLLPIPLLYWFLAPAALLGALCSRQTDPGANYWRRAPLRVRFRFNMNRVLEFFPDRLANLRWLRRCRMEGLANIAAARQSGHGVILAFVHTQSFFLLRTWLRAAGIPAAILVGGHAADRSGVKRLKDRVSPSPDVPSALYLDELKRAVRLVRDGFPLLVAIDFARGRQTLVTSSTEQTFRFATGAARLAAQCNATLIPCVLLEEGPWRFQLVVSEPAPESCLHPELNLEQVGAHLLSELLPHLEVGATQWHEVLAQSFVSSPCPSREIAVP